MSDAEPADPHLGRPLATLPYRPGLGMVLLAGGFFGLCAAGFGHLFAARGDAFMLVLLALSLGFVAMALFGGVMGLARPQRVVVYERGLRLPVGSWWKGDVRAVLRSEIRGVTTQEMSGQVFATLHTDQGPITLNRALLPDHETFDRLILFAQGATWGPGEPDAPILDGGQPARGVWGHAVKPAPVAWVDRGWGRLVLKIGALLSFCGGPLRLSDTLQPELGQDPAFAVGFAPVVLLLFGVFALWEDEPGPIARGLQHLGVVGALAIAGLAVWAWIGVARGPARPDDGLVFLGSVVSLPLCGAYLWAWWRRR